MLGTVELDEHAHAIAARPPGAVLGLPTTGMPESGHRHQLAHRRVAEDETVKAFEFLLGEDGGEPPPARIVERAEGHAKQLGVDLIVRASPEQSVEYPAIAAGAHLNA